MGADSRGEADRKAIQAIAAYIPDKVLSSNEGYAMTVGRLCELALQSASAPQPMDTISMLERLQAPQPATQRKNMPSASTLSAWAQRNEIFGDDSGIFRMVEDARSLT